MNTLHLTACENDIRQAGMLLRNGELVGIPTETVYGLAADATNAAAVAGIFEAKGRPQDNPLIVHIASEKQLYDIVSAVPATAKMLAAAFWPGPLTMIMPRSEKIPAVVSAGLPTVAVRMPSHPLAQAIIRAAMRPLAAPSANRSGSPSPTTAARVFADMDGKIAAVLDGGTCAVGVESTVISLTTEKPRLLRPGAVTPQMIEAVIGAIDVDDAVLHPLKSGQVASSPGMKYKHYAPAAKIILLRGTTEAFIRYVNAHRTDGTAALCFDEMCGALSVPALTLGRKDDLQRQAYLLFERLREADDRGFTTVYAAYPDADGVGLAVQNRLLRAAGFEVIDVE